MEAVWEEVGKAWEIFLQSASDCLAGMFFSCISYLIRSGKFSIFFSVLFFAFWTWNALLVLLVGNTFKCWETGEVMKFPPLLLKRNIFNLLCTNMKSQARLPGGSMGKDRGQHKVWDPLWGTCLCQSLLWVLGESACSGRLPSGGFLLSWGRKYPSCAINVHSAERHLKDHGARSVGEMSSGLAMCSPTLMSVTLIALAWFLHMCVW